MNAKTIESTELHQVLDDVINGLRDGSMEPNLAKEITNAAGKKINLAKAQMVYAAMWGSRVEISFFQDTKLLEVDMLPRRVLKKSNIDD